MSKLLLWISLSLLLTACQPPSLQPFYTPKEQQLGRMVKHCESRGMHYAKKDHTCVLIAQKGIYWNLPKYYQHCCCCRRPL